MEQAAPAATITKPVSITVVSISIVIPALNEEKMIGRCLESLSRLAFAQDRFEVLVIDNGSRDKTLAIAESFKDRLNLKVLQQAGVRISALRNLGARTASGDILAFLDADCLAPAEWLDRIFALAPADGAGVLGAHYLLPEDSSWVGRTWHRYQEAPKSGEVSHVPAGDLIIARGRICGVVPAANCPRHKTCAGQPAIFRFLSSVRAVSNLRNRSRQSALKHQELYLILANLVDRGPHIRGRIWPGCGTGEK